MPLPVAGEIDALAALHCKRDYAAGGGALLDLTQMLDFDPRPILARFGQCPTNKPVPTASEPVKRLKCGRCGSVIRCRHIGPVLVAMALARFRRPRNEPFCKFAEGSISSRTLGSA